MSLQDPVSDMLTRIRNAHMRKKPNVMMPSSKQKEAIAELLKEEGYISDFTATQNGAKRDLEITLKYFEGKPVISELKRESKPSRRVYKAADELKPVKSGMGIAVVSTSKGLMSGRNARKLGLGGEVICIVS
jgi:small subunit ribosomal protein S8